MPMPTPPPVPPRTTKNIFDSKQIRKQSGKCPSFGGIPTLDEQSLSDIEVFDSNYDCNDSLASNYYSMESYYFDDDDDEFVSFHDDDEDDDNDKVANSDIVMSHRSSRSRSHSRLAKEARLQKSISYHSQVANCSQSTWENSFRKLKIEESPVNETVNINNISPIKGQSVHLR